LGILLGHWIERISQQHHEAAWLAPKAPDITKNSLEACSALSCMTGISTPPQASRSAYCANATVLMTAKKHLANRARQVTIHWVTL